MLGENQSNLDVLYCVCSVHDVRRETTICRCTRKPEKFACGVIQVNINSMVLALEMPINRDLVVRRSAPRRALRHLNVSDFVIPVQRNSTFNLKPRKRPVKLAGNDRDADVVLLFSCDWSDDAEAAAKRKNLNPII